jgi:hypothetical protein
LFVSGPIQTLSTSSEFVNFSRYSAEESSIVAICGELINGSRRKSFTSGIDAPVEYGFADKSLWIHRDNTWPTQAQFYSLSLTEDLPG